MGITNPSYISSVSLLPTVEFLELVAKKQWGSTVSYGLGISTTVPLFGSTTNSEYLCLNSESEFLTSPVGTLSIKNPFVYTQPESSPVYIGYGNLSIPSAKLSRAKSLFLFRIGDDGNEVITVSNYDKKQNNITTAPPIDCFSRECLTWFSSTVDWFTGFGVSSQSLASFVVDDNGIILTKSSDLIPTIIDNSTASLPYTNIQVLNTVSSMTPWVSLQLSTGVNYISQPELTNQANILFIYSVDSNADSMVAFSYGFTAPLSQGVSYDMIITDISFSSEDIIII